MHPVPAIGTSSCTQLTWLDQIFVLLHNSHTDPCLRLARQRILGLIVCLCLAPACCLVVDAAPVITNAPASRTNNAGTTAVFSVVANGEAPLGYQWYWNGTNVLSDGGKVSGAQSATLVISNVLVGDAGSFTVVVTNALGSATSAPPAILTVTLSITADGALFSDDFARLADPGPLPPWVVQSGNWAVTRGSLRAGTNAPQRYGYAYITNTWTDYSVEGRIQFSAANAWGGGIGGRLNPGTGAHYAAWIYPDGSLRGSNVLQLIKFHTWTNFGYRGSSGVAMAKAGLAAVGTDWHSIKLAFQGNQIAVFYDGIR